MSTVDLTDPRFWIRTDVHEHVAELRRQAPVQWHEAGADGPSWAVLSHRHAMEVLADADTYSSAGGSLLGGGPNPPAGSGRMMALTDAPDHRTLRDRAHRFFSPKGVARLERRVRDLTVELIERALEKETVDFVTEVAAVVPMTLVCELMQVPDADRPEVTRLCDEAFLMSSPERRRAAHQGLFAYLLDLAVERRARPGDDLVSAFAAEIEGSPSLSLEDVVLNCDNIIVGGVQTVRHTAAMSLHTLIRRPQSWCELSEAGASPQAAVEELLRWTSVGVHVLRTARRDAALGGRTVRAGDRVVVWIPSANRDETVFDRPGELDLSRRPNRHLALGWGPHFCIGAVLARLELRILLEELVARVGVMEQTGPAVPALSIINLGLASLPVRLGRHRPDTRRIA
ncbi:cytochrome P450 [Microbispora sp. KK1-11]|uniref:cytochrome P450 n=1 Tax=Microbispora sp. KK1-11 TaxID=2053005 RepID=UPI001157E49E|nr:cytochrome P450 [Microbispora sp. KK1-11]TQS28846.1 cytochrome P450 [Microbispora sp. KK1-11]